MVTVIQAKMVSARTSRRLQKSYAANNDDDRGTTDDGRDGSAGVRAQSEDDVATETLPRTKVAQSSSVARARYPSHPNAKDDRAAASMESAELELPAVSKSETQETMETEQLVSSSSAKKSLAYTHLRSPGLSPIRSKASKDGTKQSTTSSPSTAPVPQGLVAVPVVTRSTRRETFASAKAPSKERKVKSASIGDTSPQSSTSSPSVDEKIMDLFAPPQSIRTRSRQSSAQTINPPPPAERSSSTAEVALGRSERNKKAQDSSSSLTPPSSKGTSRSSPKTPEDPKTGVDAAERKAMSTTNKRQYASATLVHIPHPSQHGSNFDPFETFHKSPPCEIDAMQKSTESAPARMPVSTMVGWVFQYC
jgi:hypothetical protein